MSRVSAGSRTGSKSDHLLPRGGPGLRPISQKSTEIQDARAEAQCRRSRDVVTINGRWNASTESREALLRLQHRIAPWKGSIVPSYVVAVPRIHGIVECCVSTADEEVRETSLRGVFERGLASPRQRYTARSSTRESSASLADAEEQPATGGPVGHVDELVVGSDHRCGDCHAVDAAD